MNQVEAFLASIQNENHDTNSGLMKFVTLAHNSPGGTNRLIGQFGLELYDKGGMELVEQFFGRTEISLTMSWVQIVRIFVQEAINCGYNFEGNVAMQGCSEAIRDEIWAVVGRLTPNLRKD